MLRFVWGLPRQQIKHYRMKVVTFGLISSPYQAFTCLNPLRPIGSKTTHRWFAERKKIFFNFLWFFAFYAQ